MAIEGMIPISTYPRWNFLLMGVDQIVNHLDKFIEMSNGNLDPKVIIRVAVGSERPVDPQCQHKGNFSEAFRQMTKNKEDWENLLAKYPGRMASQFPAGAMLSGNLYHDGNLSAKVDTMEHNKTGMPAGMKFSKVHCMKFSNVY